MAGEDKATELEWLKYFHDEADFGPADSDVRGIMARNFTRTTGKQLPDGYEDEDEE